MTWKSECITEVGGILSKIKAVSSAEYWVRLCHLLYQYSNQQIMSIVK